jgi:hypothetical protein
LAYLAPKSYGDDVGGKRLADRGSLACSSPHLPAPPPRRLLRGLAMRLGHRKRGGIFDYWGYPAELAEPVARQIRLLIDRGEARDDRSDAHGVLNHLRSNDN